MVNEPTTLSNLAVEVETLGRVYKIRMNKKRKKHPQGTRRTAGSQLAGQGR